MQVENNLYNNFKSYDYYKRDIKTENNKKSALKPKAILGAAAGVAVALGISKGVYKYNFFEKAEGELSNNTKKGLIHTAKEVATMLTMAALGNIGALSVDYQKSNPKQKKAKLAEAGFQIMNTSIPMLLVTGANILCDNVKALNNKAIKIISSFSAMALGAMAATKITNATKKSGEEKRQYTLKDTVANVDDIAATLLIGFPTAEKLKQVNQVIKYTLPVIYTYCGSRAGSKE